MARLSQWQKQYSDACSLKLSGKLSEADANKVAKGLTQNESAILQIVISKTSTTIFFSRQAKADGVLDALFSEEN